MSKWISSAYIKLLMERNRLLQGNSEYELWKQTVGKVIDAMPSMEIVRCKECKYKRINEDGETRYYYCALEDRPNRQWSVDDTDYCSWGEVRDE